MEAIIMERTNKGITIAREILLIITFCINIASVVLMIVQFAINYRSSKGYVRIKDNDELPF